MSRNRNLRVCEHVGCTNTFVAGHPLPLDEKYCAEHRERRPCTYNPERGECEGSCRYCEGYRPAFDDAGGLLDPTVKPRCLDTDGDGWCPNCKPILAELHELAPRDPKHCPGRKVG